MDILREIQDSNSLLKGINEAEIRSLEDEASVKLPLVYVKFLMAMGSYASFLAGESYLIEDVHDLRKGAEYTLKADNFNYILGADDFVFSSSQGTAYYFFRLSEGEDPPVYYFMEGIGQLEPVKLTGSFSDYLRARWAKDPELFAPIRELMS